MKEAGSLNAKTCYNLIYHVVQKTLAENSPNKGCELTYIWAKRIPEPKICSDELASALCTSVANSKNYGLECFFQERVNLATIRRCCRPDWGVRQEMQLRLYNEAVDTLDFEGIKIGEFIRLFFNGNLVLDENDSKLLLSI